MRIKRERFLVPGAVVMALHDHDLEPLFAHHILATASSGEGTRPLRSGCSETQRITPEDGVVQSDSRESILH